MVESNKQRIITARIEHPEWTLKELAATAGLTPNRVRQILKKESLSTKHNTYGDKGKEVVVCEKCGAARRATLKFCRSLQCVKDRKDKEVTCFQCGKVFSISKRRYELQTSEKRGYKGKFFCDRVCFGRYLGLNFGKYSRLKKKGTV